jgi:uncharacterized membrane protein YfcA
VTTAELALLIAGAMAAGFAQGVSGFGFSMVAMTIWVWGLPPQTAAVMAVFGSLAGQVVGLFTVRRSLAAATLLPFLLGGLAGIPLGVWLLPRLDAQLFKLALGLLLVITCPTLLVAERLPRLAIRRPVLQRLADAAAGAAGGIMGGLGGFTGVIPTLWCTLRGFDKAAQRSVIQNFNLATLAVTFATYVGTGAVTPALVPWLPVVAAALLVPSLLGARLYHGLGELAFRRVVLVLLTGAGVVMLGAAAPKVLT